MQRWTDGRDEEYLADGDGRATPAGPNRAGYGAYHSYNTGFTSMPGGFDPHPAATSPPMPAATAPVPGPASSVSGVSGGGYERTSAYSRYSGYDPYAEYEVGSYDAHAAGARRSSHGPPASSRSQSYNSFGVPIYRHRGSQSHSQEHSQGHEPDLGGGQRTSAYSAYSNDNGGIDFSRTPSGYHQNEYGAYEAEPGWEFVDASAYGNYGTGVGPGMGTAVGGAGEYFAGGPQSLSHGSHSQLGHGGGTGTGPETGAGTGYIADDAMYSPPGHASYDPYYGAGGMGAGPTVYGKDDYALSGIMSVTEPKTELYGNDVDDADLRKQNFVARALSRVFGKGVEARGIERVPEHERDGRHTIGLMLLWWSVNCVVSTFPIGLLAQAYFKLSFRMAVTAIVVFTAIGAACCGFIATLGPQTGLRTIVISRYSVGFLGGTIFAILNILTQLGFSCTAVILGGQTLTNVSEGKLPLEASIVIVGFMGFVLCFVGYEAVHYWERFAWIVQTVFYCCILALGGIRGYNVDNAQSSLSSGKEFAGGFLTFGGIVFASSAGWAPIAADFNCRLPATISPWKVFILTWLGLMVPLLFIEITSAAIMTVPDYAAAFETGDAGGVLFEIFRPWRAGGKFILVVMSFSIIANIAPNTYSASLSAQTLLPLFQRIPRAIWCIFMFCVYTGAAIGGREHFSEVLSNFLAVLGYWIAFFIVVVAEEHFIFRRWLGYDLTAYNTLTRLPVGFAGIFACCCGVGAAVVGMAQVWFVGPVGKLFGKEGGDLGFEMCAVATALVYPPLRWLEIKVFKR